MFKEGDIVHLPMNEVGIIVSTGAAFFEYDYFCKILKATLSDVGSIGGPYKNQEMTLVNYRESISTDLYREAINVLTFFKSQVKAEQDKHIKSTLEWYSPSIESVKNKLSNYNLFLKHLEKRAPNYNVEQYNKTVKNVENTRLEYKELLKAKFKNKAKFKD